jgi:VWFA-related protein
MRRAIAIFLFAAATARAQKIGQNAPPRGTPGNSNAVTFTTGTQLVVEAIVVTDKKGSPVEGLTAKDFTVTEDGVPQVIRFFDHQNLPQTSGAAPAESQPEHIHIYDKLGRTQISREEPGNARYKDRRLLALYFDMMAMPPGDQLRALAAAEKFIRTQMTPADLLAILRYSGGAVDVLQDFTGDHDRLLSIIKRCLWEKARAWITPLTTPAVPIPEPPSARTTANSTSSIPTVSYPRSRPPQICWASSTRGNR